MLTEKVIGDRRFYHGFFPEREAFKSYEWQMISSCDIEGLIKPVIRSAGHGTVEALFEVTGLKDAGDIREPANMDEGSREELKEKGLELWKELEAHLLPVEGLVLEHGTVRISEDGKRLLFMYVPPELQKEEGVLKVPNPGKWWDRESFNEDVDRLFADWGKEADGGFSDCSCDISAVNPERKRPPGKTHRLLKRLKLFGDDTDNKETGPKETKETEKVQGEKRGVIKKELIQSAAGLILSVCGLAVTVALLHPKAVGKLASTPEGVAVMLLCVAVFAALFVLGNRVASGTPASRHEE